MLTFVIDDQLKINDKDAEPNFQVLKTPDVIVCADKFLIETSPEIIKYWDKHNLTPYADRKDVKYFVFSPESDSLIYHVKNFFDELRVQYEVCILIYTLYFLYFFIKTNSSFYLSNSFTVC